MTERAWVNYWAQWRATDADGSVWEYEAEPAPVGVIWRSRDGQAARVFCPHWRETLEQRPEAETQQEREQ